MTKKQMIDALVSQVISGDPQAKKTAKEYVLLCKKLKEQQEKRKKTREQNKKNEIEFSNACLDRYYRVGS